MKLNKLILKFIWQKNHTMAMKTQKTKAEGGLAPPESETYYEASIIKTNMQPGSVAHTCNPNTLGD